MSRLREPILPSPEFLQSLQGVDDAYSYSESDLYSVYQSNAESLLEIPSRTHPDIMSY